MKGAVNIDAIDIDDWCVENSIENIARNNGTIINVFQGDAREIPKQKYNTVIANINRNILLADMQVYKESMLENATLLLSGFYTEDLPVIKDCCNNLGLRFVDNKEKNNWVSARFILE
jgi:ribosomal protein L11 methyltransferase